MSEAMLSYNQINCVVKLWETVKFWNQTKKKLTKMTFHFIVPDKISLEWILFWSQWKENIEMYDKLKIILSVVI